MPSDAMKLAIEKFTSQDLPDNPTISDFRQSYDVMSTLFPPDPTVRMVRHDLGNVPAYRFTPPEMQEGRVLFFIHGGGYALGSFSSHSMIVSYLAVGLQCPVFFPEYRLAPEHRFPAAVDDVLGAWQALIALGYDPSEVAIAGDSAGGGLVFALMLRIRELGLKMPSAAYAMSPWSDMEGTEGWRLGDPERDPFLKIEELEFFAKTYVDEKDFRNPLVAPIYGDMSSLAPVLIQVSYNELLFEDARRLTVGIEQFGGEVILEVEPDAPHVWQHFVSDVPESKLALDSAIGFILQHWELT